MHRPSSLQCSLLVAIFCLAVQCHGVEVTLGEPVLLQHPADPDAPIVLIPQDHAVAFDQVAVETEVDPQLVIPAPVVFEQPPLVVVDPVYSPSVQLVEVVEPQPLGFVPVEVAEESVPVADAAVQEPLGEQVVDEKKAVEEVEKAEDESGLAERDGTGQFRSIANP